MQDDITTEDAPFSRKFNCSLCGIMGPLIPKCKVLQTTIKMLCFHWKITENVSMIYSIFSKNEWSKQNFNSIKKH